MVRVITLDQVTPFVEDMIAEAIIAAAIGNARSEIYDSEHFDPQMDFDRAAWWLTVAVSIKEKAEHLRTCPECATKPNARKAKLALDLIGLGVTALVVGSRDPEQDKKADPQPDSANREAAEQPGEVA